MGRLSVNATDKMIYVKESDTGKTRGITFMGTRQGCDEGTRRTARRVAIRWAELTGSSEACASAAWRRFVIEGYGGHVRDAGAYDIRFHSFVIV